MPARYLLKIATNRNSLYNCFFHLHNYKQFIILKHIFRKMHRQLTPKSVVHEHVRKSGQYIYCSAVAMITATLNDDITPDVVGAALVFAEKVFEQRYWSTFHK